VIIIKQATLEDLEILSSLFDAYRQFYKQPADLTLARNFLKDRIQYQESEIFLAVDENGNGAGFVQLYPSFSSVSAKKIWILNDLYVGPQYRKQGIARKLINRAKELAAATQAAFLVLETEKNNTDAQRLYQNTGFNQVDAYFTYGFKVE
jgi:ribosomal protein S18 acetylase RimI-like enzyme